LILAISHTSTDGTFVFLLQIKSECVFFTKKEGDQGLSLPFYQINILPANLITVPVSSGDSHVNFQSIMLALKIQKANYRHNLKEITYLSDNICGYSMSLAL